MSYDFYAEFWNEEEIEEYIKRFMTETWKELWNDRNSELKKKERIFEQKAITDLLKGFYVQSTQADPFNSPIHFVKFLKETELYIQRKKGYFDEFSKKNLKKYVKNRQYYPKLPDELAKGSYIENFKHYPLSEEINGLIDSFDFNRYSQLSIFPSHTLFLSIGFELLKPYISRDDENFYIIDNPVCKDNVFKVPLVRASSWKGALRWVSMKLRLIGTHSKSEAYYSRERVKLLRLFGTEKDSGFLDNLFKQKLGREEGTRAIERFKREAERYVSKEGNRAGRLVFYPTFLDSIGLDIIAPHDRKTKTVKVPIPLEVAPESANGTFSLLYFPFDLIGENEETVKKEVTEDLEMLKDAIPAVLTEYGFGAKTTAGYGVVADNVTFHILPGMEEEKEDDQFGKEGSVFIKELDTLINRKEEQ